MEGMEYFYELYEGLPRGGPGDNASTRRALSFMTDLPPEPRVLDIGCGPGMQTLELARNLRGTITALDNHPPFLDTLMRNAAETGLDDRITPLNRSMLEMDFEEGTFDLIWSEGALYFMGFGNGLRECHGLLKEGGYMAVTEAVYLRPEPPREVVEFWEEEYPDISEVPARIRLIRDIGYRLLSHFTLPTSSWFTHFYDPMAERIAVLLEKYEGNEMARGLFEKALDEIEVYREYSDYHGYEFFVMRK